ncbi:efflux RND transporter permease subunit, partial [Rhizobiaceae sp. 2RAB30]
LRSITRPGIVTIYVDLEGTFPPEDVGKVWQEVRNRMGDIRHTLPPGVVGPFFNDDFGDVFGIVYGFTSDGFTQRELRDYVDQVRSALIADVPMIGKVEFIGAQDEEISIELRPDRIAALGLDYGQVFAAVAAQNAIRPAGTINSGLENLSLRVSGSFEHETDILEVPISAGGRMIRLGDIAEIRRGYVDPPSSLFHVDGKRAIGLGISMREAVDFLRYYAAEAEKAEAGTEARGVIACISPWNFPLAIFTGQIAAALVTGNAVIAKPAEQT